MEDPDLRIFHGNLHPVISHAVRKPCPRGGVQVSFFAPRKIMVVGFGDSQVLDSRWVLGFAMYFRAGRRRIIPCRMFMFCTEKKAVLCQVLCAGNITSMLAVKQGHAFANV